MRDDKPLVSIGMPVYNGEKYLREALDSLLAQDYGNFELIISDNASTDTTPEICRTYVEKDRRIRYYRNSHNIGPIRNFEQVRRKATGKYFSWMAHDDACDRSYLSTVVEFLENNPNVVLCNSSMRIIDTTGTSINAWSPRSLYQDTPWRRARLEFFRFNHYLLIYGVYRRDALMRVALSERIYLNSTYLLGWEFPFLAALAIQGRIVLLPELLRSYRSYYNLTCPLGEKNKYSTFDRGFLRLDTEARLLRIVLTGPLPIFEKAELLFFMFMKLPKRVFQAFKKQIIARSLV